MRQCASWHRCARVSESEALSAHFIISSDFPHRGVYQFREIVGIASRMLKRRAGMRGQWSGVGGGRKHLERAGEKGKRAAYLDAPAEEYASIMLALERNSCGSKRLVVHFPIAYHGSSPSSASTNIKLYQASGISAAGSDKSS